MPRLRTQSYFFRLKLRSASCEGISFNFQLRSASCEAISSTCYYYISELLMRTERRFPMWCTSHNDHVERAPWTSCHSTSDNYHMYSSKKACNRASRNMMVKDLRGDALSQDHLMVRLIELKRWLYMYVNNRIIWLSDWSIWNGDCTYMRTTDIYIYSWVSLTVQTIFLRLFWGERVCRIGLQYCIYRFVHCVTDPRHLFRFFILL